MAIIIGSICGVNCIALTQCFWIFLAAGMKLKSVHSCVPGMYRYGRVYVLRTHICTVRYTCTYVHRVAYVFALVPYSLANGNVFENVQHYALEPHCVGSIKRKF